VNVLVAGVGSVLPASSMPVTVNVCAPSDSAGETVYSSSQSNIEPSSTLQKVV
jgi:hypothetical protein